MYTLGTNDAGAPLRRFFDHSRHALYEADARFYAAIIRTYAGCEFLYLELSSQVQQLIEKDFKGRSPSEAFARSKIDLVGKSGEERRIE